MREYFRFLQDEKGVTYIHTSNEVLIVALTSTNDVLLVEEPAPAFGGELSLVIPGGTAETDEPLEHVANRELQEELGVISDDLQYLGEIRSFPKYLSAKSFVFLAHALRPSKLQGDEDYEIKTVPIPLDRVEDYTKSGRLKDARAIAALTMARARIKERSAGS